MDQGLIFALGVACGLLGSACFVWLLLLADADACAYLSARMDRLGVQRARRQSQGTTNAAVVPHSGSSRSLEEQPGGGLAIAPAGQFQGRAK